jgi:hypothetical protein
MRSENQPRLPAIALALRQLDATDSDDCPERLRVSPDAFGGQAALAFPAWRCSWSALLRRLRMGGSVRSCTVREKTDRNANGRGAVPEELTDEL